MSTDDISITEAPLTKRAALRREMRERRRALSPLAQREASEKLARLLLRQPVFRRSRNIGFYWAADGEIDPALTMVRAQQQNKRCFLPVLNSLQKGALAFRSYSSGQVLTRNRFGIPEPQGHNHPAREMDLVLAPLVAFDIHGNRLGMGGGFYDRTFAFKRHDPASRPILVGLAHSCQQVEELPRDSWDVPLDAVVTAERILVIRRGSRDFLVGDCRNLPMLKQR